VSDEPQNVYDDPRFFAGYSRLERFGPGWQRAVEHPDFVSLLPDARGKRVLDLGCGAGQLAHHLATAGAAEVIGVDVSERMLRLARADRSHPRVTYVQEPIETVRFAVARFDLVVSALAFHYVEDYRALIQRIAAWLTPGGTLVYSTEHPAYTGRLPGEGYGHEGPREETWFVAGVRKFHRTVATLVNGVVDAGLVVERVLEPMPGDAWLRAHPEAGDVRHRPTFLLLRARKP
jgi:2-polyprenyl-3-methyl-5-hydroxy-6-metoxy-1,4-benzoquinol methylase